MPLDPTAVQLARLVVQAIREFTRSQPEARSGIASDPERAVAAAIAEALAWSSQFQLFGMPKGLSPAQSAIPLRVGEQRRFRGAFDTNELRNR